MLSVIDTPQPAHRAPTSPAAIQRPPRAHVRCRLLSAALLPAIQRQFARPRVHRARPRRAAASLAWLDTLTTAQVPNAPVGWRAPPGDPSFLCSLSSRVFPVVNQLDCSLVHTLEFRQFAVESR